MDRVKEFWYDKDEEKIKKYKHLIMLDLEKEELRKIGRGEEFMERFEKKINQLNEDETFQSWMSREEDMRIVANTEKAMAYEEGEKQGLSQGLSQGIQQGSISKMEEIGKNLKAMGFSQEDIMKATGMSCEQILKL